MDTQADRQQAVGRIFCFKAGIRFSLLGDRFSWLVLAIRHWSSGSSCVEKYHSLQMLRLLTLYSVIWLTTNLPSLGAWKNSCSGLAENKEEGENIFFFLQSVKHGLLRFALCSGMISDTRKSGGWDRPYSRYSLAAMTIPTAQPEPRIDREISKDSWSTYLVRLSQVHLLVRAFYYFCSIWSSGHSARSETIPCLAPLSQLLLAGLGK